MKLFPQTPPLVKYAAMAKKVHAKGMVWYHKLVLTLRKGADMIVALLAIPARVLTGSVFVFHPPYEFEAWKRIGAPVEPTNPTEMGELQPLYVINVGSFDLPLVPNGATHPPWLPWIGTYTISIGASTFGPYEISMPYTYGVTPQLSYDFLPSDYAGPLQCGQASEELAYMGVTLSCRLQDGVLVFDGSMYGSIYIPPWADAITAVNEANDAVYAAYNEASAIWYNGPHADWQAAYDQYILTRAEYAQQMLDDCVAVSYDDSSLFDAGVLLIDAATADPTVWGRSTVVHLPNFPEARLSAFTIYNEQHGLRYRHRAEEGALPFLDPPVEVGDYTGPARTSVKVTFWNPQMSIWSTEMYAGYATLTEELAGETLHEETAGAALYRLWYNRSNFKLWLGIHLLYSPDGEHHSVSVDEAISELVINTSAYTDLLILMEEASEIDFDAFTVPGEIAPPDPPEYPDGPHAYYTGGGSGTHTVVPDTYIVTFTKVIDVIIQSTTSITGSVLYLYTAVTEQQTMIVTEFAQLSVPQHPGPPLPIYSPTLVPGDVMIDMAGIWNVTTVGNRYDYYDAEAWQQQLDDYTTAYNEYEAAFLETISFVDYTYQYDQRYGAYGVVRLPDGTRAVECPLERIQESTGAILGRLTLRWTLIDGVPTLSIS